MEKQTIFNALQWRYAVKVFDPAKKLSDEEVHAILEAGRLAPSSVGLEPWKFIHVKNQTLREQIRKAAYDQAKVTEASDLIVIACRTDAEKLPDELIQRAAVAQGRPEEDLEGLRRMAEGAVKGHSATDEQLHRWLMAQTYIPLGMMIETAALMGVDTCVMEGFHPGEVDEILELKSKNLHVVTMLALGHRGGDSHADLAKVRRSFDEVVEVMG